MIVFRGVLLLAVGVYLLVLICALFFSDQLIFQPQTAGYADSDEILKLTSADGAKLSAKYLPLSTATYTILFSHGNAEDIGDDEILLEGIRAAGFAVFAYDYQGYGTSGGRPTEQHAYEDAEAAYNYVINTLNIKPDRIILFGRSLGAGPATDLASRRPVAGLILESSFTSAFRVLTRVRVLPYDKFDNLTKIKKVKCPVLVIHGGRDSVVNPVFGKQLYAAANDPKQFLWVEKANHNDVPFFAGSRYSEALRRFAELVRQHQLH